MKFLDRFKTAEERSAYEEGYRLGTSEDLDLLPTATREEVILRLARTIGVAERLEEKLIEARRR